MTSQKFLIFCWQLWLVAALKGNALAQLALGEAHAVGESGATLDQGRAIVLLEVMILSSEPPILHAHQRGYHVMMPLTASTARRISS